LSINPLVADPRQATTLSRVGRFSASAKEKFPFLTDAEGRFAKPLTVLLPGVQSGGYGVDATPNFAAACSFRNSTSNTLNLLYDYQVCLSHLNSGPRYLTP